MANAITTANPWVRLASGNYRIDDVAIFVTHRVGGQNYDRERLDDMIRRTQSSARNPEGPILKPDHWGDNRRSFGYLPKESLVRHGDVVYASLNEVRPAVLVEIMKRGYPKRSVELDKQTLGRFDALSLLGADESYFPLPAIKIEMTEAERAQLMEDVRADETFKFHRRGNMKESLFVKNEAGELVEAPALYTADGSKYMLEPMDLAQVDDRIEEATSALKLEMAEMKMNQARMLDIMSGNEPKPDEKGDAPTPEGDPEKPEPEAVPEGEGEETFEKGDGPEVEVVVEEKPDDGESNEEEDMKNREAFQRAVEADKRVAEAEAEAAALRSQIAENDIRKELTEAIDAKAVPGAAAIIDRYASEFAGLEPDERAARMEIVRSTYASVQAPQGRLQPTTGDDATQGKDQYHQMAEETLKRRREAGFNRGVFSSTSVEELAEYYRNNPDSLATKG